VTKLGRYEVLNELGKGAMGVVYLAKDPVIGRLVAVKTIRTSQMGDDDSESREFRERFVREAQTAGILSHPNIVTIHDIGEDTESRTSFIAMEYIEGRNLKTLLADKKKFTWDEVADLIAQIGEALDYAHRKGIIHRDVKPANIILTTDGKVKITDFGIAKVASSNLTTTGQFLGTPNYMSPEQVSGAPVDGRSDIFSLGVVLYEMLTNRKPFQGDNLTAISYKIVHEDFTPPGDLSPEVPHEFNPIVARAMAKDPWNRFQRGKDMALALYQLKAHLEEQKALHDLGTMVSAAENLPTLKLSNLQELAAMGAPRETTIAPPPVRAEASLAPRPQAPPVEPEHEEDEATAAAPALAAAMRSVAPEPTDEDQVEPTGTTRIELTGDLDVKSMVDAAGEAMPPLPPVATAMAPRPPLPTGSAAPPKKLRKLFKAEVNPRWFWMLTASGLGLLVLVVSFFAFRAKTVAKPTAAPDAALEKEVEERKQTLDEATRLFAAGKYEESLARARQVLSRSPNNQQARKIAQMAESATASRQTEAEHKRQAAELATSARASLGAGKPEEARQKAEDALKLDSENADAAAVRDESDKAMAEAKIAAEAARRKEEKAKSLQAKKREAAPSPVPAAAKVATAAPAGSAPPPAAASSAATLRVVFEAPIPEGHVMVAVNDQILLRKPFSFKKGESRSVSASISVPPGAAAVKVWLSGPDMPSAFATTSAQLVGGETRTLQLDYSSGKLAARLQ